MSAATIEKEGGVCNTHLTAKSGRPPVVVEHGIDTWRIARYLDSDSELAAAQGKCDLRGIAPAKVEGHTFGVSSAHRMLWMEGHPAGDGLAAPGTLEEAERRVLDAADREGWPTGREAGLSRVDSTATIRFEDPRQGQAFLIGCSMLDVPRMKPAVYGRPAETVYFLGERSGKAFARIYDKGLESTTAERGQLVRLESQTRYMKEQRMSAEAHDQLDVPAGKFAKRFAPLAESAEGVTAATQPILAERLGELLDRGEITAAAAERMIGYLTFGERTGYSARTRRRRRHEARQHGLVLLNALEDPIEIDLGEPLEAALKAWAEGA